MIRVSDKGELKHEKGILDFKEITSLIAVLMANNEKVTSFKNSERTTFKAKAGNHTQF